MAWIKGRDYINNPYEDDMKIHHNEITGAYYEQTSIYAYLFWNILFPTTVVLSVIAIIDFFFPEVVTNLFASVVMMFR